MLTQEKLTRSCFTYMLPAKQVYLTNWQQGE